MLSEWRHTYANAALTGGNLVFLLIAFKFPNPAGVAAAMGLIGTSSFFAWFLNLRRFRAIADTPTSKAASAPQGYIELVGRGVHPPGEKLKSYLTGLPCLWYRYTIEEKSGDKWRHLDSGVSGDTFGLHDGTGMVIVDPDDAEIHTTNKSSWIQDHYRKTEWTLIEGEKIYVLGEHVTLGGAATELNLRQDVSDLLAEWKKNKPALLKRFDLDGDGEIDLNEWELARRAAHREIEKEHHEIRLQDGVHMIRKPRNRLFLIANRTPEQLASRYRAWAWSHLAFVIISCTAAAFIFLS
jgi:hypothetical protein